MSKRKSKRSRGIVSARWIAGLGAIAMVVTACQQKSKQDADTEIKIDANAAELAQSREAFKSVYAVLMHPRCMNCHPSGDAPLQGEDSRIHAMNVQRGLDGKGMYAMKCSNCHQPANVPGLNMPPGNPNWHLPPANMKMVFQGKSPAELARQLKDPSQTGGKNLDQLIEHVTHDSLVLAGWDPGEGRSKPPLSHDEFAKKFREWVEKGAAIPQ